MDKIPQRLIDAALLLALASILFLFACLGVSFIHNQQLADRLGELFSTLSICAFFGGLVLGFIMMILNIIELLEER